MTLRVFSFGGGVQSTACMVLAAQGRIGFKTFLFANVGEDAENPATLAYFRDVAQPYAAANGLDLIETWRIKRDGSRETLLGRIENATHSIPIPVRMGNGAPGNRTCTKDFKIDVIAKWLKQHGATAAVPAVCGIGISLDEWHRARTSSGIAWERIEYPLLDLRLTRQDCIGIIRNAGLPIPPKSSCYFCPFHRLTEWQRIKRETPDLFVKSCEIEALFAERRAKWGKDAVWLTRYARPLAEAVGDQLVFDLQEDDMETCGTGHCFT